MLRSEEMKLTVLFVLTVLACAAQDPPPQDAEGCTDSPFVARFPGSYIKSCDHKEFESFSMPVSKDTDGNAVEKAIEGEYFTYDIGTREGLSPIQLYRNFDAALLKAGWKIIYAESPDRLSAQKAVQYLYMQFSGPFYYLTTVKQQAMKQEVVADATAMGSAIEQSGHVAIYGVHSRNRPSRHPARLRTGPAADQSAAR